MSIARMKKLSLLLPRPDMDRMITKLIYLRSVDIVKAADDGKIGLRALRVEAEAAELRRKLASLDSAIKALARYTTMKKSLAAKRAAVDLRKFESSPEYMAALKLEGEVNSIVEKIELARVDAARFGEKIKELEPWALYDLPLSFTGTAHTIFALGTFPASMPEERFVAGILEAGGVVGLLGRDGGAGFAVVICYRDDEDKLARALAKLGFIRATFRDIDKTPAEALEEYKKAAEGALAACGEYEAKLRGYAARLGELEVLYDAVSTELRAAAPKRRLAATENCVFLTGWVPEGSEARVVAVLDRCDCAYELAEPAEGDEPPILLSNNSFAKNFEWVIGMYSYPKYGSYDPSFIMGIFYCLIFGLMFADAIYGLIMVVLCFGGVKLLRPREGIRRFLLMFGYCGISCAIMGVLFGGYMSDLVQQIMTNFMGIENPPSLALLVDPLQNPVGLLVIALIVGGVHLIAGMAVKMYITWRDGHPLDAILDTLPWWLLFTGLILLYLAPDIGRWVALSGVAALVLTQGRKNKNIVTKFLGGALSLYNLINIASDLVSYSRIMALGLASAVLGQVMNILGIMLGKGPIGFIFMILVFVVGHGLNIALNLLGSFVHTSRLQYIEFFGKFFEGGGRAFAPVLPADKYTADNTD